MATVHRGPSSFAPPQSQSTAAVHEYRCLFTHDIKKKQKKWHDGSLKFHTFNRRVMVYDDTKNYVGDLHYRQEEDFGEGLEFQLDKPVKVEVGERLGESNTDLTLVLNKQRPDTDSPARNGPSFTRTAVVSRINAANSQGRPKSIKELLGASQGRLGRANISTQSPFEQRQASNQASHDEPPPKKQRLASGQENTTANIFKESNVVKHCSDSLRVVKSQRRSIATPHAQVRVSEARNVIDLSSDEGDARVGSANKETLIASANARNQIPVNKIKDITPVQETSIRQIPPPTSPRPTRPSNRAFAEKLSARKASTPKLITQSRTRQPASTKERGPRTSLRFAPEVLRRKLVYKALLPSSCVPVQSSGTDQATELLGLHSSAPRRQRIETFDLDELFADLDDEHVRTLVPQPEPNPSNLVEQIVSEPSERDPIRSPSSKEVARPEIVSTESYVGLPQSSPLFIPQSQSQKSPERTQPGIVADVDHPSPSHTPRVSRDLSNRLENIDMESETESPSWSERLPSESPPKMVSKGTAKNPTVVQVSQPQQADSSRDEAEDFIGSPSVSPAHLPTTSPQTLDTMNAMSIPSPTSRPFRRILSEGNKLDVATPNRNDVSPLHQRTPRPQIHPNPDQTHPTPARLHRSISDSAAIINNISVQNHSESSTIGPQSGPWTEMEAFLLFEWWPPGMQKPTYAQPPAPRAGNTTAGLYNRRNLDQNSGLHANVNRLMQAGIQKKYGSFGSARLVSQR